MPPRPTELIDRLDLRPHPEGGFYREVFRSPAYVMRDRMSDHDERVVRAALTTIYYLLPAGAHSRWHQVASDEVWHFYEGDPLELLQLTPDGRELTRHRLEPVGGAGAPVHTVPAHAWQAARPLGEYTLVGCTVAPGFDFADFRLLADDPALASSVREWGPELVTLL